MIKNYIYEMVTILIRGCKLSIVIRLLSYNEEVSFILCMYEIYKSLNIMEYIVTQRNLGGNQHYQIGKSFLEMW